MQLKEGSCTKQAAMEKAWHLIVSECHAPYEAKYIFREVYSENYTVQNTIEISSHKLYAARRQQAS